jgi:hypothetical protein
VRLSRRENVGGGGSGNQERATLDCPNPKPKALNLRPRTQELRPLHHSILTLHPHADLDYAVDQLFSLWPRYQRRRPNYDVIQVVKVPLANDVLDRGSGKSLGNVAANSDGSIQIHKHLRTQSWGRKHRCALPTICKFGTAWHEGNSQL